MSLPITKTVFDIIREDINSLNNNILELSNEINRLVLLMSNNKTENQLVDIYSLLQEQKKVVKRTVKKPD